jgi:hypothetical protein
MGRHPGKHHSAPLKSLTTNAYHQSIIAGKYAVSKIALYVRCHLRSGGRSADTLSHQLWSVPSAIADILIAIAMTLLVCDLSPPSPLFSDMLTRWVGGSAVIAGA